MVFVANLPTAPSLVLPYPGHADGVRTIDELERVVDDYFDFDEFVVDVETLGPFRGDPHRNIVFWISLAGPGRAEAIPCGHPLGELIDLDPVDDMHRINPANGHYQEHKINETTGRLKWEDIPVPFTDPPEQLDIWDVIDVLRPLFFSGRRIVGQNLKFDLLSLGKYFGAIPKGPYADTLVAAKLIDENFFQYSLGQMVKREFHFEYEKIGRIGPEQFPYSEACHYSYLDAKYTWLLWRNQKDQMEAEHVRHVFDMEMDLFPAIMDMERIGTPIDEEALDKLGEGFIAEMEDIQLTVDETAGDHINLNANRQVAHFVYGVLEHKCTVFTPSGERSTSKETLEALGQDEYVKMILEHAALRKLDGTFIKGLKKTIVDGRVHPDFNQVGAVSGRLSARHPNIQQIPSRSERGKRVREVFVASPGKLLVVSDLSQIELRMLAHLSQDRQLMKTYRGDADLHSLTAAAAFGPNFTPIQRTFAKNVNFSILYGAGPLTIVRRYGVPSVKMAKRLLNAFYMAYPSVEPWKQSVLDEARSRYRRRITPPYVTTILGRKRRLPDLLSLDRQEQSAAERQAISVVVSGSAADLFKLAMIQCYQLLEERAWEGHVLMTVHDELVVEVPEKHAEEGLRLVKTAMEDIINPFTEEPILTVPVVADAKIVTRWSDAK